MIKHGEIRKKSSTSISDNIYQIFIIISFELRTNAIHVWPSLKGG